MRRSRMRANEQTHSRDVDQHAKGSRTVQDSCFTISELKIQRPGFEVLHAPALGK